MRMINLLRKPFTWSHIKRDISFSSDLQFYENQLQPSKKQGRQEEVTFTVIYRLLLSFTQNYLKFSKNVVPFSQKNT